MNKTIRNMVYAAIIAALYMVLTYLQNFILPGSATWAIQFRVSEALCIFAFFTPAAISGLTIGCFLFNLSYAGALPLDFLLGSLATLLAALGMWKSRKFTVGSLPLLGLLMPAITNAIFIGAELTIFVGSNFAINALYVALGEAGVLLTLGTALYCAMRKRNLDRKLFGA